MSSDCLAAYWFELVKILAEAQAPLRDKLQYRHYSIRHNFTHTEGNPGAGGAKVFGDSFEYDYFFHHRRTDLGAREVLCTRDEVPLKF